MAKDLGRRPSKISSVLAERYAPTVNDSFYTSEQRKNEKRTLLYKPVCAIDSEGITLDNQHRLIVLQALWPTSRAEIKSERLATKDCLDFLHDNIPQNHVSVVYGATYDFSNWLRDIPLETLIELFKTNRCWSGRYFIKLIPGKYLLLHCTECKWGTIIYDVISFYQTSFVKACKSWEVGSAEEIEYVTHMKELRGNFADVDPDQIQKYCWLELELLIDLVKKLQQAILKTPYRPRGLYGPGALAQAVLSYHKVTDYYGPYDRDLALLAYYGGRFDTALFGWFENVYQHDIRSAYPDQIRFLPCLKCAKWEDSIDPARSRYGFYHVKWNVGESCAFPPFPWRDQNGCIWYPYKGEGWYHADEVRAAIEVFGKRRIRVIEGSALIEGCDHQPFAFVENLYQWRLQLEAEGNHEQGKIVKLIINSLYGKTVQSVGIEKDHNGNEKLPEFQNFFYGGAITAGTRAKILRAIKGHMDQVISIATDGIVSKERLNHLQEGKQLGEWEIEELITHIQISNGVYYSVHATKGPLEKTRGIGVKTIDWDRVREIYLEHGPMGVYKFVMPARFRTLRDSVHRNDMEHACQWIEETRELKLQPARRYTDGLNVEGKEPPYCDTDALQIRFEPITMKGLSAPFKVKQTWAEVHALRDIYNLPLEGDL